PGNHLAPRKRRRGVAVEENDRVAYTRLLVVHGRVQDRDLGHASSSAQGGTGSIDTICRKQAARRSYKRPIKWSTVLGCASRAAFGSLRSFAPRLGRLTSQWRRPSNERCSSDDS